MTVVQENSLVEELIDLYAEEIDILAACYERMGNLLDRKRIQNRAKELNLRELYIYGGGYLGIQFYYAVKDFIDVISIIDKSGKLLVEVPNVEVIDFNTFQKKYRGQQVVITPIKHYDEIYNELISFISEDRILFLEDF